MPQKVVCHACEKVLALTEKVGRQDTCPECQAYLHCCLNCRFFEPTAYNECREPQAERVLDKGQANFCDYFEPRAGAREASDATDEAKKALEGLFKKGK